MEPDLSFFVYPSPPPLHWLDRVTFADSFVTFLFFFFFLTVKKRNRVVATYGNDSGVVSNDLGVVSKSYAGDPEFQLTAYKKEIPVDSGQNVAEPREG